MPRDDFNPGDYRRFSNRKRSRDLTDEERREHLLDFIKTNLDEVFYNQYAQNEKRKDYMKLVECIDEKIMPELAFLFERDQNEAKEKIDQARIDLIKPITEASEKGDKIAEFALSEVILKHIKPSQYKSGLKDTLRQNIPLLQEIDQNIEAQNIELFEKNASALMSELSRSPVNEDDILIMFNDLDRCRNIISISKDNSSISPTNSEHTMASLDENQPRETPPISTFRSIASIPSQEDGLMILHPEKYSDRITSALNVHSNIVGEINLAISNRDFEGIQNSRKKLMSNLRADLDNNERGEILQDINRIYKNLSVQQKAINAVQPIVNLAKTVSMSPTQDNLRKPPKLQRSTKSEGRN
ncbi:MAG: hypothetical protein N4A31_01410 [Rickettsiales bacterium]|jgi:hypothetical protein|nr:hypothetical protein [Rickettsiales bacterium]